MQPFRPCWTSEDAAAILNTEALRSGLAVFRATHTRVDGFDIAGSQAADFDEATQEEVARVLADPARRHAFCVVQGEPGSGKSHLIKWLKVEWPDPSDIVLLIRRADGSLEGALTQLEKELGADFADLFQEISRRSNASDAGRANMFLTTLATVLQAHYYSPPLEDAAWCAAHKPEQILLRPSVQQNWKAPERILRLIDGASGERNSQTAAFDLFDILDLTEAAKGDVIDRGLSVATEKFWHKLQAEMVELAKYRSEKWTAREVEEQGQHSLRLASEFVDALNRRRNDAIRNVIGISPDGLKTLFRKVRQRLALQKRRLVLLLEDITSFEGVDDSLIDVLVDDAATQTDGRGADVCALISVVGITPHYRERLQGNYRQRITHELRLGDQKEDGLQDVALLRDEGTRLEFILRYLSAIRAGVGALETWSERSGSAGSDLPNVCTTCSRRAECFTTFGAYDDRGLFPFNETALRRFYEALKENDQGQTWRTPRGIIQAILSPVLRNTRPLEEGVFPSALIESEGLSEDRRADRAVSFEVERTIKNRLTGVNAGEVDRVRRLITYWGHPDRSATTSEDGMLSFAGVKRPVFEAFDLPWPGEDEVDTRAFMPPPSDPPSLPPEAPYEGPAEQEAPEEALPAPTPRRRPLSPPGQNEATGVGRPPSARRAQRSDPETLRNDLNAWRSGASPVHAERWNALLVDIAVSFDFRRYGIRRALQHRLITSDRIKMEGSVGGSRERFLLPREDWVVAGLDAYISLDSGQAATPSEYQSRTSNYVRFVNQYEDQLARYLLARLPRSQDGIVWDPDTALAQVLVMREMLRGRLSPGASPEDALTAILKPEEEALSAPRRRAAAWQSFLTATDKSQSDYRDYLIRSLDLGGEKSTGMIDGAHIYDALRRTLEKGEIDPVPEKDMPFGTVSDMFNRLRKSVDEHMRVGLLIRQYDLKMQRDRAQKLSELLNHDSIARRFGRFEKVITQFRDILPDQQPRQISDWLTSLEKVIQELAGDRFANVEEAMLDLTDPEAAREEMATGRLICWLAALPVADLDQSLELLQAGENLAAILLQIAQGRIAEAEQAPDLSLFAMAGQRLRGVDAVWTALEQEQTS